MSELKKYIEEKLTAKLEELNLYLVETKVLPGNKVRLFIDGDSNVTIQQCTAVSRYIEPFLDESDLIKSNYNLEVSSPGMTQPIKVLRQYKKRIGRELEITTNSDDKVLGTLKEYDNKSLTLEIKENEYQKINHDDIKKSIVQFKFSKVK